MNCLHIRLPDGTTRKIALGSRPKVIGRDEDADIILEDTAVSRYHCTVAVSPNGIHVQDLSSSSGTRINGRAVTSAMLQNGDKLEVGPFTFVAECAVTAGFGTAIRLVEEQFAVGKGFQTFLGEIAAEGRTPPASPKPNPPGETGAKP
jgi:pSer/pThr/pTyr-binding forkhead associated (FHA) protein